MTREEAIKYLNEFIFFKKISNTTEGEVVECFKLAVEALQEHQHYKDLAESYEKTINKLTKAIQEQQGERTKERTETHECDCISRKDIGLTNLEILMCNGDYKEALKMLLDKIEKAPSVNPQQKTGHWTHDGSNWTNRWICSECGYKLYDEQSRFCPECGSYNGGAK